MKKLRISFIIAFLLLIYLYVCKIDSIPNSIIIYNGDSINLGDFIGITLKIGNEDIKTISTSNNFNKETNKESTIDVKLFDTLTVKQVSVHVIDETTIIPVGQVSGLKLYTNGVLVVGMGEIKAQDGKKYKPYENSGIEEGNRIIKINGEEVKDTENMIQLVNKTEGENIQIEYIRQDEVFKTNIVPIKAIDGKYKIGLWVRDSSAGIGTLTLYEPSTGNFAALGHGITDIDTGDLLEISNGEFVTTKIMSIIKGVKGNPRKNTGNNR